MLPFPAGNDAVLNALLALSAAAALTYLCILKRPASLNRALIKTAGIALLAAISLLGEAPVALTGALLLAALGDFLLAGEGDRTFQAGLSSFLVAQMALVFLFLSQYSDTPMHWAGEPWRIALALAAVGHSYYLARLLWMKLPRELGAQIVAYALVITVLALFALAYAPLTVLAGVALFYFSDTLIAHERFLMEAEVNQHPVVSPLIWATYYLAQLLIVLGVIA